MEFELLSKPEEEKNYDLNNSTSLIGQLYPVLKAADGEILDGYHRTDADPNSSQGKPG